MSEKTQQIIELVRIKSWYVPKDVDSYQILKAMKTPLLKMHRDFLPVLKLAMVPRGIRARQTQFDEILGERLDRLGAAWKSKPGRSCKLTERRLQFSAPSTDRNRRAIAALETSWSKFCIRWGLKSTPVYSEKEDRLRLVIDYAFDPSRNPIIESVKIEPTQSFELELGNTKFKITMRDKPTSPSGGRILPPIIHFETFAKAGSEWKLAHTGTCVDTEIGDLAPMMQAISLLTDRREVADRGIAYQPWAPIPEQTRNELIEDMRTMATEAEGLLFKLAQAPNHAETGQWLTKLWTVGRRIPRLAAKLKDARINVDLTRQQLLSHLNNPRSLYPFFMQKDMTYVLNLPTVVVDGKEQMKDLSPVEIDERAAAIWPRLLRIKAAWIAAGTMDAEKGAAAFKASTIDPIVSVAEH